MPQSKKRRTRKKNFEFYVVGSRYGGVSYPQFVQVKSVSERGAKSIVRRVFKYIHSMGLC